MIIEHIYLKKDLKVRELHLNILKTVKSNNRLNSLFTNLQNELVELNNLIKKTDLIKFKQGG